MTRAEIEQSFTIRDGVIRDPGKFEGEMLYVPYYYMAALDGLFESIDFNDGEHIDYMRIEPADAEMFPELASEVGHYLALRESDQGFVYGRILNKTKIDRLVDESENEPALE